MISSFYERIVGASPPPGRNQRKILCVGLCCLDIVHTCRQFPLEDTDQRSLGYGWQRGGNASNTCTVLSLLGSECEFFGTLSTSEHLSFLQDDMHKHNIDFQHCPVVEGIGCPMSTIILSLSTGSRTILHHNPNLPELTLRNFTQLNLDDYSWIHFEGRNVVEVISMIQYVERYNELINCTENQSTNKTDFIRMPITISVELENAKPELLDLLPYADVAFVAKEFAQSRGFDNMSETVRHISEESKSGATIICAWGDRGAMAHTPDGAVVQSPAFPPQKVIDTLGAGDTFNAAVLHYLNKEKLNFVNKTDETTKEHNVNTNDLARSDENKERIAQNHNTEKHLSGRTEFIDQSVLQKAITFGCRVAGTKIGHRGYSGIEDVFRDKLKIAF